jgi:probable addiction module antidote protein
MALKTKPLDLAKYYGDEAAQASLLNDALASGHAGYIANALGIIARARGMTRLAEETGVSRAALYASLSPDGNPSLDTLMRVTARLGIELRATVGGASPASPGGEPHDRVSRGQ